MVEGERGAKKKGEEEQSLERIVSMVTYRFAFKLFLFSITQALRCLAEGIGSSHLHWGPSKKQTKKRTQQKKVKKNNMCNTPI